jgi:anti-sigma B factor antagonist
MNLLLGFAPLWTLWHPTEPGRLLAGRGAAPNPLDLPPACGQRLINLPRAACLEVEQIGDVTVVKFTHRRILTAETVETIGAQLMSLVEVDGRRRLVLDFSHVDRLATAMLGKLVMMHQKIRAVNGRLALCRIAPHLSEIFTLLKLPQVLDIYRDEPEALQSFAGRTSHYMN